MRRSHCASRLQLYINQSLSAVPSTASPPRLASTKLSFLARRNTFTMSDATGSAYPPLTRETMAADRASSHRVHRRLQGQRLSRPNRALREGGQLQRCVPLAPPGRPFKMLIPIHRAGGEVTKRFDSVLNVRGLLFVCIMTADAARWIDRASLPPSPRNSYHSCSPYRAT